MIVGVCGFGFGTGVFGYALVRNLLQGRWALIHRGLHGLSLVTTSANPPLAPPLLPIQITPGLSVPPPTRHAQAHLLRSCVWHRGSGFVGAVFGCLVGWLSIYGSRFSLIQKTLHFQVLGFQGLGSGASCPGVGFKARSSGVVSVKGAGFYLIRGLDRLLLATTSATPPLAETEPNRRQFSMTQLNLT